MVQKSKNQKMAVKLTMLQLDKLIKRTKQFEC